MKKIVLSVLVLIAVSISSCTKSKYDEAIAPTSVVPTTNIIPTTGGTTTNNGTGGTTTTTPVVEFATMSVNIKDVQYNDFKPAGFPSVKAIQLVNFNGVNYLKIEGGDTSNYQLLIYVPENQWKTGTYNLNEMDIDNRDGGNSFSHINVLGFGKSFIATTNVTQGTITITEFNKTTNTFKAYFNFDYTEIYTSGNSSEVFSAKNGIISYSL
jgi:hypothetical protein